MKGAVLCAPLHLQSTLEIFLVYSNKLCFISSIKLIVSSLFFDEMLVISSFYYASLIHHHYHISILNGRQSVSYDEYCSSMHQIIHTSLYYRLSPGVYRRRGLVEYHDRRVCNGCSGYRYELSLTLRKTASVSGKHRIIAVGKHAYEAVGIGQFSGGDTFLVRSVQLAVTYIIHHRSGEQIDFLKNHSKGTAQVVLPDPVYIDAVVLYLSVINIVEPVYEIGYGGLSCSCRSHQGNLLSRFGIYCYIRNRLL